MSTRPVPTNLDSWPGVTDLLIAQKYILHVLWSSDSKVVSVIGVGRPGVIERLCSASRLDEPVVLEALRELDRRGLVVLDEQTREVAIRRWVRFHKFSGRWAQAAQSAFNEVLSPRIKSILIQQEGLEAIFPAKSKKSNSNSNSNSNYNKSSSTPSAGAAGAAASGTSGKKRRIRLSGIVTWTIDDEAEAEKIEKAFGEHEIKTAVESLLKRGKEAVPGLVTRELENQQKQKKAHDEAASKLNEIKKNEAGPSPRPPLTAQQRAELGLKPRAKTCQQDIGRTGG